MLILITGSRKASGQLLMKVQEFIMQNKDNVFIVGDAMGVDNIAILSCDSMKSFVNVCGAYGKLRRTSRNVDTGTNHVIAGDYLSRDRWMVDHFKPDMCVAFWDGKSRGTKYTMRYAFEHGVKIVLYTDDGNSVNTYQRRP